MALGKAIRFSPSQALAQARVPREQEVGRDTKSRAPVTSCVIAPCLNSHLDNGELTVAGHPQARG